MQLPVYLRLDLTTGEAAPYPISRDDFAQYVGGKCLAAKLLLDLTPPGLDPLDPASVCIINTGPLTGTGAPSTSRFNLTFKNVLTGGIASSNCGGPFGMMLKKAGYDGLILTGRAPEPVIVEITDAQVRLQSAHELWGMDMEQTQQHLPSHYAKLVIGPAGEHLVHYASAASGERMAGRCGTGAVLGSKHVKALIAYGTRRPTLAQPEKFHKFIDKWVRFLRKHPMTGQSLPRYGSAGLVNKANAAHALPVRNFQAGYDPEADAVSGETLAETELVRNSGCISCPIRCERRVRIRGREVKGPEYETIGFFGPNIGGHDLRKVIDLNYVCDTLGMDTISAASSIAFAMELRERGLADFGLEFGRLDNLEQALNKIALREPPFDELANGVKWLSEHYGAADAAMHAKGLEMASYEPRRSVGMGLGYATANRGGCHLGGGYTALLESVGVICVKPQSPKAKAELTVFLQNALEAVSSAGCCLFSAQTFIPAIYFRLGPNHPITRLTGSLLSHSGSAVRLLLAASGLLQFNSLLLLPHAEALRLATGLPMKMGSFLRMGERAYNLERLYNLREGLTGDDDALPARLTKTPQDPEKPDTVVPLEVLVPRYYRVRGWDAQGVPKEKRLRQLKLSIRP